MLSCIIIDDEPYAIKLLEKYIERIPTLSLLSSFVDVYQAHSFLKDNPIDIIFLDIEMPGINGLEFTYLVPESVNVIFTTAYSEHAIESYNKGAIDYLLKPIHFDRLALAVNRVLRNKTSKDNTDTSVSRDLYIKEGRKFIHLQVDDVFYIKGLKDYVEFRTKQKKYIVLDNLKRLERQLPADFMRVHYSYIINCEKIEEFKDNHVLILNDQVPVSKKYQEDFIARIKKRMI